jgi:hypothetical protein
MVDYLGSRAIMKHKLECTPSSKVAVPGLQIFDALSMVKIVDIKTRKEIPITEFQREWVETVANESVDNLDIADIMELIEGMEAYYGNQDKQDSQA